MTTISSNPNLTKYNPLIEKMDHVLSRWRISNFFNPEPKNRVHKEALGALLDLKMAIADCKEEIKDIKKSQQDEFVKSLHLMTSREQLQEMKSAFAKIEERFEKL